MSIRLRHSQGRFCEYLPQYSASVAFKDPVLTSRPLRTALGGSVYLALTKLIPVEYFLCQVTPRPLFFSPIAYEYYDHLFSCTREANVCRLTNISSLQWPVPHPSQGRSPWEHKLHCWYPTIRALVRTLSGPDEEREYCRRLRRLCRSLQDLDPSQAHRIRPICVSPLPRPGGQGAGEHDNMYNVETTGDTLVTRVGSGVGIHAFFGDDPRKVAS